MILKWPLTEYLLVAKGKTVTSQWKTEQNSKQMRYHNQGADGSSMTPNVAP